MGNCELLGMVITGVVPPPVSLPIVLYAKVSSLLLSDSATSPIFRYKEQTLYLREGGVKERKDYDEKGCVYLVVGR